MADPLCGVVPFCLLLSQSLKRNARKLGRVAAALFAVHFVEVFWLMAPKRGGHLVVNPFDVILPLLIGGCWIWFVVGLRERRSDRAPAREAIS
jgi:hypothetical protein